MVNEIRLQDGMKPFQGLDDDAIVDCLQWAGKHRADELGDEREGLGGVVYFGLRQSGERVVMVEDWNGAGEEYLTFRDVYAMASSLCGMLEKRQENA